MDSSRKEGRKEGEGWLAHVSLVLCHCEKEPAKVMVINVLLCLEGGGSACEGPRIHP